MARAATDRGARQLRRSTAARLAFKTTAKRISSTGTRASTCCARRATTWSTSPRGCWSSWFAPLSAGTGLASGARAGARTRAARPRPARRARPRCRTARSSACTSRARPRRRSAGRRSADWPKISCSKRIFSATCPGCRRRARRGASGASYSGRRTAASRARGRSCSSSQVGGGKAPVGALRGVGDESVRVDRDARRPGRGRPRRRPPGRARRAERTARAARR